MKSNLFKNAVELFKSGKLDWVKDQFFVALTSGDYTPDFKTDTTLSDIPDGCIIGEPVIMRGNNITDGKADANDVVFRTIFSNQLIEGMLIYAQCADSEPLLVAYISNAGGLPATPNGGDIEIHWSRGINRIFSTNWEGYTYD